MRIRTGYSFRNAAGRLSDVADRLKEIGSERGFITDRASTFSWVNWRKECERVGLTPMYGVELAVSSDPSAKKPTVDHWSFFAEEDIAVLHELVRLATEQFRYEPILTLEQANDISGVRRIAGHRTPVEKITVQNSTVVSWSPASSWGYLKRCVEAGHRLLPCSDNRYIHPWDRELYAVLVGRNTSLQSYPQHILSPDEWGEHQLNKLGRERFDFLFEHIADEKEIIEGCNAELKKAKIYPPEKLESLEAMCRKGAQELNVDLNNEVYAARLKRELDLIAEKQFEDYFYIIAEMVAWSRERMVVGPARGSSCGSLVCYLLGITTVDPIPYGLIFERFIDINRADLPDIDIDFSDVRREMVFEHMRQKYGYDHVARLGTVSLYKPRSCLNEVGGALDIPPWEIASVTESLVQRSSGDSRALAAVEDTLAETEPGKKLVSKHPEVVIAARMEGHPRHAGQHAAGIVLTDRPVTDYVAVDSRTLAAMCDKKDAEVLDLLKIDALGLTQLSIFEDCLELMGKGTEYRFLEGLPLDDEKAFQVLNDGHFSGIFQFEGIALQSLTKAVTVVSFEDIVSITALARPGPLNTGGATRWTEIKNGKRPVELIHPDVDEYLASSSGIVIYQEQVMQIGRALGSLSWEDVSALRKAMSKSLGEEFFNQYAQKFLPTASEKIGAERAKKLWDELCAYGSWAFNRSHAVAYGLVSYYCCWLKAHHPVEFAAATLNHQEDPERQLKLLRELDAEGIKYLPVDKETSTNRWTVKNEEDGSRVLVGPVTNVKGIGPKLAEQIKAARAAGDALPPRAEKLLEKPVTPIDELYPIDARRKILVPDPVAVNILTQPTRIIDMQQTATDQDFLAYVVFSKISPKDENEIINVEKRGYKLKGAHLSLGLQMTDDTDTLYGKINVRTYPRFGPDIIERGGPSKHLYCVKGRMPGNAKGFDFRMLFIDRIKYIGPMED